jgi:Flp pilus assembly pilin Flp
MKNPKSLPHFHKNQDGVAAIEFGFIAPLLFLIFFGLVDLTGFISTSRKVTSASAVVADLVSQNTVPFPKSQLQDYFTAVKMIMPERDPSTIRLQVIGYKPVGTSPVVPTVSWTYDSGSGPACSGAIPLSRMPELMTGPNDLVVARVCVNYEPYFGTWKGSPLLGSLMYNVNELTITRPRAKNTLTCMNC